MDLHEIASKICAAMPEGKANKRKCVISFTIFTDGSQWVNFTPFFIKDGIEINKDISFYDFYTDEEHKKRLREVIAYLQGEINEDQLFNTPQQ